VAVHIVLTVCYTDTPRTLFNTNLHPAVGECDVPWGENTVEILHKTGNGPNPTERPQIDISTNTKILICIHCPRRDDQAGRPSDLDRGSSICHEHQTVYDRLEYGGCLGFCKVQVL